MLVLALETSTLQGSVSLGTIEGSSSQTLFSKTWLRQRSHGELVTAGIEDALKTHNMTLRDIGLLVVDQGPGSFTGIRVGLSAIKTLSYSTKIPVLPFNSLETLANQVPLGKCPLLVLINAHKSQSYAALFSAGAKRWKLIKKPRAVTAKELESLIKEKTLCVGDGFLAMSDDFSPRLRSRLCRDSALSDYPLASTLIRMASQPKALHRSMDWKSLAPLYIRASEAEEKLRSGLLKALPEL